MITGAHPSVRTLPARADIEAAEALYAHCATRPATAAACMPCTAAWSSGSTRHRALPRLTPGERGRMFALQLVCAGFACAAATLLPTAAAAAVAAAAARRRPGPCADSSSHPSRRWSARRTGSRPATWHTRSPPARQAWRRDEKALMQLSVNPHGRARRCAEGREARLASVEIALFADLSASRTESQARPAADRRLDGRDPQHGAAERRRGHARRRAGPARAVARRSHLAVQAVAQTMGGIAESSQRRWARSST